MINIIFIYSEIKIVFFYVYYVMFLYDNYIKEVIKEDFVILFIFVWMQVLKIYFLVSIIFCYFWQFQCFVEIWCIMFRKLNRFFNDRGDFSG